MKKTLGSVISKVLAVAFIAIGFMIIRPSAAYAEDFNITVTNDGHGTGSASPTSASNDALIELSATSSQGYVFDRWTTDSDIQFASPTSANTTFRMIDRDVTVKANFKSAPPTVYRVTIMSDGHGEAYANKRSGVSGTRVMLREVPDDGYRFKQWEVISGGVVLDNYRDSTPSFTIGSADVVIKAHFEKKEEHTRENDYGPEESKSEAAWTPEKAAATIAAEKAVKQQAAGTQLVSIQTMLRTKTSGRAGTGRNVIDLDMTKVDILDRGTVNLLVLNNKFEYNIKISVAGGATTTVKIPANFNLRPFIKADGTMNIHEVLWSIILSRK